MTTALLTLVYHQRDTVGRILFRLRSMIMPKTTGGVASLTPEQRRAISSKGGIASDQRGAAHEWTREEARIAGKKGGEAARSKREKGRAG
jgi:hypothetical protein